MSANPFITPVLIHLAGAILRCVPLGIRVLLEFGNAATVRFVISGSETEVEENSTD